MLTVILYVVIGGLVVYGLAQVAGLLAGIVVFVGTFFYGITKFIMDIVGYERKRKQESTHLPSPPKL